MQTWSPQQVGDWLREIGLGQHSATFEQNAIGGPELLSINPETLDKTLRVARSLHRKKIMTRLSLIVGEAGDDDADTLDSSNVGRSRSLQPHRTESLHPPGL